MSFVQDEARIRRKYRCVIPVLRDPPDGDVGQEQVMVDHDDVGLRRLPPGGEQETLLEKLALDPLAEVWLRGHFVPYLFPRLDRQVAQRAVLRLPCPLDQFRQALLLFTRKQGRV